MCDWYFDDNFAKAKHQSRVETTDSVSAPISNHAYQVHTMRKNRDSAARPAPAPPLLTPKRTRRFTRNAMSTKVLRSAPKHDLGSSYPLRRSLRIASRKPPVGDVHNDDMTRGLGMTFFFFSAAQGSRWCDHYAPSSGLCNNPAS